jgi:hypothetical protein
VNVTGLTLTGAAAGNYSLASSSAATTANITSRALTITANHASKPYDGAAYTGGNGVTYVGFASGETNTDLIGALAFGGTSQGAINAGSYTLVPSGYSSGNYAFSYVNGALTISQVTLLVTADDTARLYDEVNPTFTASYAGFVNSEGTEVISGFVIVSTAATNGSDAGTYALEVDASFLAADNYSFATSNGVLTINPVSLTGTVTSSANPSPTGSNVTFTATLAAVAPGSTTPSGTMQFYVDGSAFGAPRTLSSGSATLTTNSLTHGLHTISAAFLGNVNYNATSNSLAAAQLINRAPTAGTDTLATRENTPVNAAAFKLLLNDSDADSDSLTVTAVSAASAQGGTVALSGVTVTYTPPTDYSGADSFTYTVTDSFGGTNTGTVNVTVNPASGGPERVVSNEVLPDGNQHLVFAGIPGFSYVVQATTNLSPAVWVNLSTNTAGASGLFNYNDLNATNYSMRYYRSVSH